MSATDSEDPTENAKEGSNGAAEHDGGSNEDAAVAQVTPEDDPGAADGSQPDDPAPEAEKAPPTLEEQLDGLKTTASDEQDNVVVIRTVPREQAKQEIRELFATGETLYYSDIVERLGLDIALVVDICKELEAEGEVSVLGDIS